MPATAVAHRIMSRGPLCAPGRGALHDASGAPMPATCAPGRGTLHDE